ERVQQHVDRLTRVRRQRLTRRRASERLDSALQIPDVDVHVNAPAETSAARTVPLFASFNATTAKRSTFRIPPTIDSAAFTGSGLDSANAARIHGSSLKWSSRAPAMSPAAI